MQHCFTVAVFPSGLFDMHEKTRMCDTTCSSVCYGGLHIFHRFIACISKILVMHIHRCDIYIFICVKVVLHTESKYMHKSDSRLTR